MFFTNKDRIDTDLRSNVIYKFNCEQCNCSYIGETSRHLSTRIREHIAGKSGTEVGLHEHPACKKDFSILYTTRKTKIAESIILSKNDKSLLLNDFAKYYPLQLFPPLQ